MQKYQKTLDLWRSFSIGSTADLDKYLNSFRILFAYNSGKIENACVSYHDTREIFEHGTITGFSGKPRVLIEQHNQKLCYEFLKGKMVEKEPLSPGLVLDVHKALTMATYDEQRYIENNERPGEYKKNDYVTSIYKIGLQASEVESSMNELIGEVNSYSGGEILKAASYLHAQFEYIQPFAYANGRTGRAILNYYLIINGHPPLIVFNEDKKNYYIALHEYDMREELTPLYEFFCQQCEKTWEKELELSEGGSSERKGLSDYV